MSKIRFLSLFKPLQNLIPEIKTPCRPISSREKIYWTGISLFIFLVCCQIPLLGVVQNTKTDPFYWARVMLASNKGTIMELGISPIITASMVMQLLVGARIINCNFSLKEDRELFNTAQKALGILICLGEAAAYVLSGAYGHLSIFIGLLVITQLLLSGIVVLFLDDLMTKGYGLGGGISLFIATNICEKIIWSAISPTTINTENGTEFEGALIALVYCLATKSNKIAALKEAFYRTTAPNCMNIFTTIFILGLVIYFHGFRVELPLKHRKNGGQIVKYPIKLFYSSNTPVILQTAIVSHLYTVSQLLYSSMRSNPLINLIGQWQTNAGGISKPVGGIAYYISPPTTIYGLISEPLHTITYITFILVSCAVFSRYWVDISGSNSKDVARTIRDQGFMLQNNRDSSMVKILDKYINTAASLGGVILGVLTILADFFDAIGSGTGILLAVTIIFQYYEQIVKENMKSF